jgi:TIR domain
LLSVFLSYSHKDREVAKHIANALEKEAISVWLDEWEILVGDSITQRVQQGLEQVDFVIPLLTVHSVKSGWVEKEWQSQIGLEAERKQIRVLPIRGDDCEIPTLLRDKRYADLKADYSKGLSDLVWSIHRHSSRRTANPPKSPPHDNNLPTAIKSARARWRTYGYALVALALLVASGFWIYSRQFGTAKRAYEFNKDNTATIFARKPSIVPPAQSYRVHEVRQLPNLDYSNFEVLEDRRVIDLRDWKPFNKDEEGRVSPVTWSRKVRLRKTGEAEQVRFLLATEGSGIDAECVSSQDYYLETAIIATDPPQLLMKAVHMIINVMKYKVGEEFEIEFHATFWNGTSEREDWVGYKIYAPVKVISMMLLFPEQKVFKWKKIILYKPGNSQEYPPPENQSNVLYTPDFRVLYWEIKEPMLEHSYEIQWGW